MASLQSDASTGLHLQRLTKQTPPPEPELGQKGGGALLTPLQLLLRESKPLTVFGINRFLLLCVPPCSVRALIKWSLPAAPFPHLPPPFPSMLSVSCHLLLHSLLLLLRHPVPTPPPPALHLLSVCFCPPVSSSSVTARTFGGAQAENEQNLNSLWDL